MTVLLVNITGPDGKQRQAGEPVPKSWDADYVKSLIKSGGAGTQKAWDERVKANEAEAVQVVIDDFKAGRLGPAVQAVLDGTDDDDRKRARLHAVLPTAPAAALDAILAGGEK